MDTNEILSRYTAGEAELDETNEALKEAGAGFHLEPGKNEITDEDRRETVMGYYPEQAFGWGLLDTGTGSLEKVHIAGGKLAEPVNEVLPGGGTNMKASVIICGRTYEVLGDTLAEIAEEAAKNPPLPVRVDMSRRTDLAGQTVEQRTKAGTFLVSYDGQGYAVKALKKEVR